MAGAKEFEMGDIKQKKEACELIKKLDVIAKDFDKDHLVMQEGLGETRFKCEHNIY
ncbi:MAG: hypothetical protein WAN65_29405 [Candidatus Sulfotelmatobacter sp.]